MRIGAVQFSSASNEGAAGEVHRQAPSVLLHAGSYCTIPPYGILSNSLAMKNTDKIKRLNRIAGQVRGVAQMVEDDRYCMDILNQIAAIKSALAKVESQVLKDHAACCVAEAIASGDEAEQREKFEELVDLFERTRR